MPICSTVQAGDAVFGRTCAYSGIQVTEGDTVRICDTCGAPTLEARAVDAQANYVVLSNYRCANCGASLLMPGDPGYVAPSAVGLPPPPPPPLVGLPGQPAGPGFPPPAPFQPVPPPVVSPVAAPSIPIGLRLPGPMSLGDALDRTFKIYRSCFKSLIAGSALVHATVGIPLVAGIVALAAAMPNLMQANPLVFLNPEYLKQMQNPLWQYEVHDWVLLVVSGALFLVALVVYIFVAGWGYAAQACAALAGFQERSLTPGEALTQGRPFHWSALGQRIVVSLIIGAAASCCLFPAIFVAPLFMLCLPAIVVERIGALDSLGRSVDIVKRDYWRLVGWTIVLYLIFIGIQYGISALVALAGGLLATVVGNVAANGVQNGLSQATALLLSPILVIGSVVFYLDARVRQEGLDVMPRPSTFPTAPPPSPGVPQA